MIDEGMKSKDEEKAKIIAKQAVEEKKVVAQQIKEGDREKLAFNQMAVHFHDDDDIYDSWE